MSGNTPIIVSATVGGSISIGLFTVGYFVSGDRSSAISRVSFGLDHEG